ncbi:MAG: hypothetical protein AB8G22_19900 [Saprospiraceae bacterium]
MNYTKTTLKKIETILEELDYTIRYEKGNFQSGYCMVESRKMAVVNKFFDTEGRINMLLEILGTLEVNPKELTEKSAKFYKVATKSIAEKISETESTETE